MDEANVQALPQDLQEEARRLQARQRQDAARQLSRRIHGARHEGYDASNAAYIPLYSTTGLPYSEETLNSLVLHRRGGARPSMWSDVIHHGSSTSSQKSFVQVLSREHMAALLLVMLHPGINADASNLLNVVFAVEPGGGMSQWLLSALLAVLHRALGYDHSPPALCQPVEEEQMQVVEATSVRVTSLNAASQACLAHQASKVCSTTRPELSWLCAPYSHSTHGHVPLLTAQGDGLFFSRSAVPAVVKKALVLLVQLVSRCPSSLIVPLDYSFASDKHVPGDVSLCDGEGMRATHDSDIWALWKRIDQRYAARLARSPDSSGSLPQPARALVAQADISSSFLGRILGLLDSPTIRDSAEISDAVLKVASIVSRRLVRFGLSGSKKGSASEVPECVDLGFENVDSKLVLSRDGVLINSVDSQRCIEVQAKLGLQDDYAKKAREFTVSKLRRAGACRIARPEIFEFLTARLVTSMLSAKGASECQLMVESISRIDRAHSFQSLSCILAVVDATGRSLLEDLDKVSLALSKAPLSLADAPVSDTSGSDSAAHMEYVDESLSAALRSQVVNTSAAASAPTSRICDHHLEAARLLADIVSKQATFVRLLGILRNLHTHLNKQTHDLVKEFSVFSETPSAGEWFSMLLLFIEGHCCSPHF